jgi:heme-degrading monooxygenase HmoA
MAQATWTSFVKPQPAKEYLAVLSYLPLSSFWALPQFLYYSRSIQKQLKSARGLVGYSLLAHVLAKRFWTLSVWENEVALAEFVHKMPHSEAMTVLHRSMGGTEFVRWKILGASVPPTWQEAMERSQAAESDALKSKG